MIIKFKSFLSYEEGELKFKDEFEREDFRFIKNRGPIVIENFRWYYNKWGQICFRFNSPNHKYLHIDLNSSCSPTITDFSSRGIEIEDHSSFTVKDGGYDSSVFRAQLNFHPESEEEDNAIKRASLVTLAEKWAYSCVIVPWGDFYVDNEPEGITLEEIKSVL